MARRRFEDPDKGLSIRPDRIGSLLARILQERIVRGFADPRIRGLISVTGVDVSSDLRRAVVRVSVLPASDGRRTISGLRSVAGLLRRTARDQTSMKRVPDLEFRLDESMKRDAALDQAIREGLNPAAREAAEKADEIKTPDQSLELEPDSPELNNESTTANPPERGPSEDRP